MMMKQHMTLKDLARELGISPSTVSKALNNSPEISVKTKKKVRELADLLQYYPNSFAQGLKYKRTKTLGVIVPAILSNFFSMVLDGIEEKASELGYRIIICISKEALEKEKLAIDMLIKSQVDGILISPSKETQASLSIKHLQAPKNYGIPIVMFDRLIKEIEADKISINDCLEAELATMELIRSGCRNVVYFSGMATTSVNEERKQGYKKAMENSSATARIIEIDFSKDKEEKIKAILEENSIDGILTSDELTTVQTARSVLTCGYKIPKDISLIGFTNGKMGENFMPSLTTVDQKAKEQGEIAVQTLIDRLEDKLPLEPIEFILKADIIHRESTKNVMMPT